VPWHSTQTIMVSPLVSGVRHIAVPLRGAIVGGVAVNLVGTTKPGFPPPPPLGQERHNRPPDYSKAELCNVIHGSSTVSTAYVEFSAAVVCEWDGAHMRSTEIVTAFWDEVWNAHEPDAVDRFVADDVVIEAGGQEIAGKDNIKNWVKEFLDHVNDLHVDPIETFQNDDGTRVTSRWVLTGTNNGILGTEPNSKPIAMTGTAVWNVDEDGKLQRGWLEQASFELYHWLLAK